MEESGFPVATHLLQHTLRSICMDTQWVYAVFWRILPRSYPPPKWDGAGGINDRSKGNKRNWILVWEDGFCDFAACARAAMESKVEGDGGLKKTAYREEDLGCGLQPELFFKMSHEVYNFGEGLMGKVAADNSHKWIFRDPLDHEVNFMSPWHNSIDPHPRTWESQFKAGIQTIAVMAVREGLVQLGATKKVIEDLNFVMLLQRKFNYLQTIPGVFLPHPSTWFTSQSKTDEDQCLRQLDKCHSWNGTQIQYSTNQIMMLNNNNDMMSLLPPPPPPPPPPPALHVMPSMSSLQALLSKLPSVTNSPTPPLNISGGFLTRSFSCPRQSFSEPPPMFVENPQMPSYVAAEEHESGGDNGGGAAAAAMNSYLSEVID